jgi:RNA polymerase sigma-70 factor (ECF subfamily)
MQAVAGGDLDAFGEIVSRHQKMAWGVACRFLGDATEGEDVAQEAFLKVLDAAPRYRPTASFRTYLYQVVSRLCLDRARKRKPEQLVEAALGSSASLAPAEQLSRKERDEAIQRAITGLPANQRLTVLLRYFEGLSTREIAATLDVSEKAVERLLARAREALEPQLLKFFKE